MPVRRSDSAPVGRPSRRDVLKVAALTGGVALAGAPLPAVADGQGIQSARTLVGAIRWDAYTGRDWRIGMGANRMLSPAQYRFRLPFYSDITVAAPTLLNESFDTGTTGAAPAGWTTSAGTGSSVSVVDGPDRPGKSVLMHDGSTTGGMATMSHAFGAQTRAITVKWDWKETVAGGWTRALVTSGSTTIVDIATQQVAGSKQLSYRTSSGAWQVIQTIADNTWYSVKVIVDPAPPEAATPWVDIFVDGVRGAYHVPFLGTATALDQIQFQTNPTLSTDLYVDNVSVEVTESVNVDATSQAIMDQEIQYASAAGVDYWAFDYYPSQPMTQSRDLYLSSAYKNLVNWCAILDGNFGYGADFDANLAVLVARMAESNYQKVLSGRPLVYIIAGATADRVTAIRSKAAAAGLADPYVVVTGWTAQTAADLKTTVGADAVSRYAAVPSSTAVPYSTLTVGESSLWSQYATAAGQVVPTVTTGWDPRDRHDYPAPWGPQPDTTYLQDDDYWAQQATPEQIAAHLADAINWTKTHLPNAAADTVLIYAWNENLEGGWICPTLDEINNSGSVWRLDAIAGVNRTG
ncbi:twin-arginine translocation signal domain-containing protein [Kribbella sp. NPDC050124]|uniref:twin-arginine translocation signal domain-containing protein n=1 Tax=Kribbella sp. NPDC050124 TaxID=3364114 RepID=UPI00379EF86A